jgi:hypothetical protein
MTLGRRFLELTENELIMIINYWLVNNRADYRIIEDMDFDQGLNTFRTKQVDDLHTVAAVQYEVDNG